MVNIEGEEIKRRILEIVDAVKEVPEVSIEYLSEIALILAALGPIKKCGTLRASQIYYSMWFLE